MNNKTSEESGMPNFAKTGVPRTDEEAIDALRRHVSNDMAKVSIAGIYKCRRALGDDINDAIIYCPEALIPKASQ